jgi:hypothetical protein
MKKPTDAAALQRYRQEHDRCLGVVARELRTEKGTVNVSLLSVQRLETNQLGNNYQLRNLFRVISAFGVEPYELYKRAGNVRAK